MKQKFRSKKKNETKQNKTLRKGHVLRWMQFSSGKQLHAGIPKRKWMVLSRSLIANALSPGESSQHQLGWTFLFFFKNPLHFLAASAVLFSCVLNITYMISGFCCMFLCVFFFPLLFLADFFLLILMWCTFFWVS